MTILVNPFRAGSGIDINYNTGTIANSGVLSVDSNTGNLTLSAGTGISISGLTITNTGVDSLVAGTGISLSATTGSVTVTNSGVTSFQGDTGSISLSAGTGISISGLTISNAGVTSLQSETGALSLTAGTGIGISGLTISNDGVTSLTAGTGISLSGSTGGVTITNSGITSLTAGNGISVSGSTIAMSGSYSGSLTVDGTIASDTSSGNNFYIEYNATLGASQSDVLWFDIEGYINGNEELSLYSKYSTNSSSDLSDIFFGIYSFDLSSDVLTLDLFSGEMQSYKNILDDGSGSMTVAGNLHINTNTSATTSIYTKALEYTINSTNRFYTQVFASEGETVNVNSDYWFVGWGATGQNLLKVYGSGNMSVSGSLTVTDDVTTDSSFVAIGNGFNPNSSVDTANIQSGTNSNPQAFGGGIMLRDNSYFAGLWTDEDGATLELGAGGSATSISAQLSVNTSSVSIAGSLTVGSSLTVNGVSFADMAIQLLASNTGGVTFPSTNTYNIVASFGSFYVGSNSSIYVSCLGMEYNSGGGANQYLIISDTALTVGDSYSSVTYALELTGAAGQTTDSTTSTLFFGSSGVSVTAGAEYYVYYGTALTHYTHYLTYATALISFQ